MKSIDEIKIDTSKSTLKTLKIDDSQINPVTEATGDKIHRVMRGALSAIPSFGGTAVELFNTLISPPLEKRKQEWMIEVTNALNILLERHDINIESLLDNQEFTTILIQASTSAIKNHQKEKLDALLNAVINSTLPEPLPFSMRTIFIDMIDRISEWHLRLLFFFESHNGPGYLEPTVENALEKWIEGWFIDLKGHEIIYKYILQDLVAMGLIPEQPHKHGQSLVFGDVTELGRQFVHFVKNKELTK
ncbi:MAG: hypothetical protein EPN22_16730 [Nitrospirae bacterium]|nr:MAG: hypothetical protein EPN22_16730 [Nitrospirota bacterium]